MKCCFLFLVLVTLLGCSKDANESSTNNDSKIHIDSISSLRAKIGDTLTIYGSNLDKLPYLYLNYNDEDYEAENVKIEGVFFVTSSNEKIQFKIPTVRHGDITIYLAGAAEYKLEIVGLIPLGGVNNPLNFNAELVQTLMDKIAYRTGNGGIYKSSDGFFNWGKVVDTPENQDITSFFFLDENHCWISLIHKTNGDVSMHYSEDGGKSFIEKFKTENTHYIFSKSIRKIHFTSVSNGFFIDREQQMYFTDNETFENIYDHNPELGELPFGRIELWDFNIMNENLMFLAPNGANHLIKIENQNVTHYQFDGHPSKPIFFGNIGYLKSDINIWKSSDLGNNWAKIKSFDGGVQIHFIDENTGLAFVDKSSGDMLYKTVDGGATWKEYWSPEFKKHINSIPTGKVYSTLLAKQWKYIEE